MKSDDGQAPTMPVAILALSEEPTSSAPGRRRGRTDIWSRETPDIFVALGSRNRRTACHTKVFTMGAGSALIVVHGTNTQYCRAGCNRQLHFLLHHPTISNGDCESDRFRLRQTAEQLALHLAADEATRREAERSSSRNRPPPAESRCASARSSRDARTR